MKRKVIEELIKWKELDTGKPILLTGAKGVGKTYLAYDFAKAFFKNICYLNFEREQSLRDLLLNKQYESIKDIILSQRFSSPDDSYNDSILILDEIIPFVDICEFLNTLQSIQKYRFAVMITSSSVPDHEEMFHQLAIYPLDFDEFLRATNNDWYIELIINHYKTNTKIPNIVHKELLELHQLYLRIGGLPGAINEYLNFSSLINIPEQHNSLIGAYHDAILRDYSESEAFKMNQVFDSLVMQLMKENKKFQFKLIRKGTTYSMYKDAIRSLSDLNYVIQCNRITTEQLREVGIENKQNIVAEESATNFKIYMPDIGMLCSKISEIYGLNSEGLQRKAILENYVAQSLQAKNYSIIFWESESMAKIDFMIPKENKLVPIEVHEDENTRSKSISVLKQKYDFEYAIKISARNFEYSNGIKYVPYYAVFCI